MKTSLRNFHVKWLSNYRLNIKRHINVMASVKRGRALVRVCFAVLPIIGLHPTSSRVRLIVVFLRNVNHMVKHNGPKGACIMLKCIDVLLQQASGGHRVHDLSPLKARVKRTHSGIPRIIPREVRASLRRGDFKMMRFYRSLFNLFVLFEFKGDMRLASLSKSIISPGVSTPESKALKAELRAFIPWFLGMLMPLCGITLRGLRIKLEQEYADIRLIPILKSSPFTMSMAKFENLTPGEQVEAMAKHPLVSSHPGSIWKSVQGFKQDPVLYHNICYFLSLVKDSNPIKRIFFQLGLLPVANWEKTQLARPTWSPAMGKLGLKAEAAGKVRVFAMVDPWTQWVLRPLHLIVQSQLLGNIPQDGTLDQMRPVKALLARIRLLTGLWSVDLSSATDRLPLDIQVMLHAALFGEEFADNWASLLVNRRYKLTLENKNTGFPVNYFLKYAVGQPMGAYSSWNSLALTHHLIVQFAAYKAGVCKLGAWFKHYAIVGDDVVIGNAAVTKMYLKIMKVLGVGIGLHKSLLSPSATAMEFCKRTFWLGQDVSPVRFAELQAAFSQPAAAVEFIKKYNLSLAAFVKAAGFKFNVLGGLNKPFAKLNSKIKLLVLAINVPVTVEDINTFFSIGIPKNKVFCFETLEVMQLLMESEFKRIKKSINSLLNATFQLEGNVLHLRDAAKEMLREMPDTAVPLRPELAEDLAWAKSQVEAAERDGVPADWLYGEGFRMNPPTLGPLEFFDTEIQEADSNPHAVLATVTRLCDRYRLGVLEGFLKPLTILVQGRANEEIKSTAMQLNHLVIKVMLSKFDMTAAEVWMSLIDIQRELGKLPLSQVKYQRLIDDGGRRLTEGTHIRLWKSLSNVVRVRPGVTPLPPKESPVKTGGYLWF